MLALPGETRVLLLTPSRVRSPGVIGLSGRASEEVMSMKQHN